jgi:hypothetical protein
LIKNVDATDHCRLIVSLTGSAMQSENNSSESAETPIFQDQLRELLRNLRAVDAPSRPSIPGLVKYLVARLEGVEIRMDASKNHGRGHIHIKYKKDGHAASYAIDDGTRLAGNLPQQYERTVQDWISKHRSSLQDLWDSTQCGEPDKEILLTFQTEVYD